ncbi:MAG: hypothetical protein E6Q72_05275 [Pseudomonas sp.]|nr:MAG: hypothetical protein E6Q72_05275 [Pseudomonas sp.]
MWCPRAATATPVAQAVAAARAAFPDGRSALDGPERYPARQILETCQTVVARLHRLSEARVVYAQQNPAPIDQGVFLNDVIAVVCGEGAGMLGLSASGSGREKLACCGGHLQLIEVPRKVVSVADALDPACSTPAAESLCG